MVIGKRRGGVVERLARGDIRGLMQPFDAILTDGGQHRDRLVMVRDLDRLPGTDPANRCRQSVRSSLIPILSGIVVTWCHCPGPRGETSRAVALFWQSAEINL